jgi:hypothetical protein
MLMLDMYLLKEVFFFFNEIIKKIFFYIFLRIVEILLKFTMWNN